MKEKQNLYKHQQKSRTQMRNINKERKQNLYIYMNTGKRQFNKANRGTNPERVIAEKDGRKEMAVRLKLTDLHTTGQAVISVVKMSRTNQQKITAQGEKQSVSERDRERGVMNGALCEFAVLDNGHGDFTPKTKGTKKILGLGLRGASPPRKPTWLYLRLTWWWGVESQRQRWPIAN